MNTQIVEGEILGNCYVYIKQENDTVQAVYCYLPAWIQRDIPVKSFLEEWFNSATATGSIRLQFTP